MASEYRTRAVSRSPASAVTIARFPRPPLTSQGLPIPLARDSASCADVSAEAIARKLVERVPGDARGHEALARLLLIKSMTARERGDEAAALASLHECGRQYDAAVECAPEMIGLRQSAGTVWLMASEPVRALEHFEAAAVAMPTDPQPPLYIAQILMGRGDHAGAERHLAAVLALQPGQPQALATLAVLELERGDIEQARRHIADARAGAPDDLPIRVQAARIERRSGNPRGALELLMALDRATRADESVTIEVAAAWLALTRPDEAAGAWVHRFNHVPGEWRAAARASGLWFEAGRLEDAVGWFDQARQLAPSDAPELAELAELLGR